MKKILFAIIMTLFSTQAYADIALTTPLTIKEPAIVVKVYSYMITPDNVVANLNYHDASGNIVKQDICTLDGTDYNNVMSNSVTVDDNGKKVSVLMRKKIQNRCKFKMSLVGVED